MGSIAQLTMDPKREFFVQPGPHKVVCECFINFMTHHLNVDFARMRDKSSVGWGPKEGKVLMKHQI